MTLSNLEKYLCAKINIVMRGDLLLLRRRAQLYRTCSVSCSVWSLAGKICSMITFAIFRFNSFPWRSGQDKLLHWKISARRLDTAFKPTIDWGRQYLDSDGVWGRVLHSFQSSDLVQADHWRSESDSAHDSIPLYINHVLSDYHHSRQQGQSVSMVASWLPWLLTSWSPHGLNQSSWQHCDTVLP